jgi:hypothetical protein
MLAVQRKWCCTPDAATFPQSQPTEGGGMRAFLSSAVVLAISGLGLLVNGAGAGEENVPPLRPVVETAKTRFAVAGLQGGKEADRWTKNFAVEKDELVATGRNPYFILEAGYTLILENGDERLTVTVLNETKKVDGVECRVVVENETKGGKEVEKSRNYFAISKRSNSVFYFGEDVGGAWLSGEKGAKFGLMMAGLPLLNATYYQELATGVAMDRAEIVGVAETVKTPAGEFKNCLKIEETTPLEPGTKEHKFYAPGIGLVQDGALKLVKYGNLNPSK